MSLTLEVRRIVKAEVVKALRRGEPSARITSPNFALHSTLPYSAVHHRSATTKENGLLCPILRTMSTTVQRGCFCRGAMCDFFRLALGYHGPEPSLTLVLVTTQARSDLRSLNGWRSQLTSCPGCELSKIGSYRFENTRLSDLRWKLQ